MKGRTGMQPLNIDLPDSVHIHRDFWRSWQRLPVYSQQATRDTILRLLENPAHPSLHVHEVKRWLGVRECYISKALRLLYRFEQSTLHLLRVGPHRDIERAHLRRSHSIERAHLRRPH